MKCEGEKCYIDKKGLVRPLKLKKEIKKEELHED